MPAEIHPQSRLPFHDDPDPEPDPALAVRFEGRPLGEQVRLGVSYLKKLLRKKWSARSRLADYLDRQRAIFSALRRISGYHPAADSTRIALLGDLMWIRDGWDGYPSPGTLDWLHGHTLAFGNLETVVSPRLPVPSFWPDAFAYNSHPGLVDSLRRPDGSPFFSALGLANNHILDQGDDGARDTLDFLEQRGIAASGIRRTEDERAWCEIAHPGLRVGFHAAGYGINDARKLEHSALHYNRIGGIAPDVSDHPDFELTARAIDEMRAAGIDFIIVSLHWGFEFEACPTPKLMTLARELARRGADVVCGHHPHQPQCYETVFFNGHPEGTPFSASAPEALLSSPDGRPRKSLLIPSLGNFTSTMFTPICRVGFAQGIEVGRDPVSGTVDWHPAPPQWFCNLARHPQTGRRALVTAEEFATLPCAPAKMARALQTSREFLNLDA